MSRMRGERCDVQVRGGVPWRFHWRGRWYRVLERAGTWVESSSWWGRAPGPSEWRFWRVSALSGDGFPGTYELSHEPDTDQWWLVRVMD